MGLKIAVILSLHFRHAAMSGMIINILSLPEKSKEEKNKYKEEKNKYTEKKNHFSVNKNNTKETSLL